MHKSRLGALVIDCKTDDLFGAADFWRGALGLEKEAKERTKDTKYIGLENDSDDVYVLLQSVDHESRVHIDIETDDIPAEVKRLESLGATVVAQVKEWTVMQAPSGQRFCVIDPIRKDFATKANSWE